MIITIAFKKSNFDNFDYKVLCQFTKWQSFHLKYIHFIIQIKLISVPWVKNSIIQLTLIYKDFFHKQRTLFFSTLSGSKCMSFYAKFDAKFSWKSSSVVVIHMYSYWERTIYQKALGKEIHAFTTRPLCPEYRNVVSKCQASFKIPQSCE